MHDLQLYRINVHLIQHHQITIKRKRDKYEPISILYNYRFCIFHLSINLLSFSVMYEKELL
jgi:hypothetical protein